MNLQQLFQEAVALHQRGDLAGAEKIYRRLHDAAPDSFAPRSALGILYAQRGQYAQALDWLEGALRIRPTDANTLVNCGNVLRHLNRPHDALANFDKAVALDPGAREALLNRGAMLCQLNRFEEASKSFAALLALQPDLVPALLMQGSAMMALGRFEEAMPFLDRVLRLDPNALEALSQRGVALWTLQRYDEALANSDRVLALQPANPQALYNRGLNLQKPGRFAEALACYDQTLALAPDHFEARYNRGNALWSLKRFEEALACYDAVLAVRPNFAEAVSSRGLALWNLKRRQEALASFDAAIAIQPNLAQAWNGRGNILWDFKRFEEALASFDRAVTIDPNLAEAWNSRGNALQMVERYSEAVASYEKAIAAAPGHPYAIGGMATVTLFLCDWPRIAKITETLEDTVRDAIVPPFTLLGYDAGLALQRECARRNLGELVPVTPPPLWRGEAYRHEKFRVAYVSSDFGRHPVSLQMVEMLEHHDHDRFEIFGISTGDDDASDVRARIVKTFDHFHDAQSESDATAAAWLRTHDVDIAIDLGGHTRNSRLEIFSRRPCPVQASWLGYAGTTAADFMDYVIADPVVVPFADQPYYSEHIVHLPDSFFPCDTRREVEPPPARAELGLPETGFVFCCFNKGWKITEAVFDVWMRLLDAVPGSVLWLRAEGEVRDNLCAAAAKRGIDPRRLCFAGRVDGAVHLARHRLADLFLDTQPYNAHATACDALQAGLPVLACHGRDFAGRVSASLLQAAGLPELVVENLEDYEALALRLARNASLLQSVRRKLEQNRHTAPLFDMTRLCRNMEAVYARMRETSRNGDRPAPFGIEA